MLTQEQFTLYTKQPISYSDEDWVILVNIAELRLASFLCLGDFPELTDENQDLAMLLANFIASMLKFAGSPDEVDTKSVRNFTIKFKSSAANAFSQVYAQYRDIIEKYSKCDTKIKVESNAWGCCGWRRGYLNF